MGIVLEEKEEERLFPLARRPAASAKCRIGKEQYQLHRPEGAKAAPRAPVSSVGQHPDRRGWSLLARLARVGGPRRAAFPLSCPLDAGLLWKAPGSDGWS